MSNVHSSGPVGNNTACDLGNKDAKEAGDLDTRPTRTCWICRDRVKEGLREGRTALHFEPDSPTVLCPGDRIPFERQAEGP